MNLITFYFISVLACIILHTLIGVSVLHYFKSKEMLELFTSYYASYKKRNRGMRYYLKYIIYLIPILNILIVGVEIIKHDRVIKNIENDIDIFRKETHYENRN